MYEGEYESLRLNDCKDVRIRHARIGELHASDSTLIVEDSHLGGGEVALYASSSTVEMASVRIEGEVGIFAQSSRFDIAGGDIAVTRAVMQASSPSTVAFSLSRVKSPALDGLVHDFFSVTEKTPIR